METSVTFQPIFPKFKFKHKANLMVQIMIHMDDHVHLAVEQLSSVNLMQSI